jgi:hypothetical protein
MTLGANVTLVPESVVYGETLEDYLLQCDYSIPPGFRAAQTPKLGDPYPGDTAPWGYIVVETGSATAYHGVDRGAYLTGVKYAKPKIPFTSGIPGLYEIARKKATARLGRRLGERVFLAADANADALAEANLAEGVPMEGSGSWMAAVLREKTIERRWRVGIAKITAQYDSYAQMGEVMVVGKGLLECDAESILKDFPDIDSQLGGHQVDVPYFDTDKDKIMCWLPIKGPCDYKISLVRAKLRIRVILSSSNLASLCPLVGKINSDACPHIIGAGKWQLWFVDLSFRQRKYGQSSLYDCIIYLLYHPVAWEEETVVQLHEHSIIQQPVRRGATYMDTGQKQRLSHWIPQTGTANIKKMKPADEASFALINGYLA